MFAIDGTGVQFFSWHSVLLDVLISWSKTLLAKLSALQTVLAQLSPDIEIGKKEISTSILIKISCSNFYNSEVNQGSKVKCSDGIIRPLPLFGTFH